MNNLMALLKVQFLSLFGINKLANKKQGKKIALLGIFGIFMFFVAIIVACAYIYSKMFAQMYIELGDVKEFLPTMFSLVAVICLVFSFYLSNSNIYDSKDYELLTALPIKTNIIVISKLMFMYLADLGFAILFLVPSVFVHFEIIGSVPVLDIVRLFIMALALPVFPMVLSIALGTIISLISLNFQRRTLVQSFLYVLIFIGAYALSMLGTEYSDSLGAIKKIYFPFPIIVKGMNSFIYSVIFFIGSIVILAIVLLILCLIYKKLNNLLKSFKRAKSFKLQYYRKTSQFRVLMKKEIKLLFSSITYAMNTLFGSIMAIIATVAFIVLVINFNDSGVATLFAIILQAIFAFSLMISPTTAVSISVEGATFYIMKTSPIPINKLLRAKLFVNILFATIPALISAVSFAFVLKGESAITIILFILNCPLFSILGGNLGLIFNLLFPYMKWDNINKPVKQSLSGLFTILSGTIIAVGTFLFMHYINMKVEILFLIVFVFLFISSFITYLILMKKGETLINKRT